MSDARPPFVPTVHGTFFRAIDPAYRDFALAGSRSAGRYSRPEQPTLYLGSSPEGVEAAMPSSWRVRAQLEAVGASGLVDPSRKRPGLWHLVLFRWNEPGAPTVTLATP